MCFHTTFLCSHHPSLRPKRYCIIAHMPFQGVVSLEISMPVCISALTTLAERDAFFYCIRSAHAFFEASCRRRSPCKCVHMTIFGFLHFCTLQEVLFPVFCGHALISGWLCSYHSCPKRCVSVTISEAYFFPRGVMCHVAGVISMQVCAYMTIFGFALCLCFLFSVAMFWSCPLCLSRSSIVRPT